MNSHANQIDAQGNYYKYFISLSNKDSKKRQQELRHSLKGIRPAISNTDLIPEWCGGTSRIVVLEN
jgi:L-rhamnose isomerase